MRIEKDIEISVGEKVKNALAAASRKDGLKRTQRWLAGQIGIGEVELCNKIANLRNKTFTPEELKKINSIHSYPKKNNLFQLF